MEEAQRLSKPDTNHLPDLTKLVPRVGFEPTTYGLQNRCSTRLSYHRQNWLRQADLNRRPSGYEPDELPGCSTAQRAFYAKGPGTASAGDVILRLIAMTSLNQNSSPAMRTKT